MLAKNMVITDGLDVTRFASLVNTANRFQSEVSVIKDGRAVNAKSILGVMALAITKGNEITLKADGTDAEDAIEALQSIIH